MRIKGESIHQALYLEKEDIKKVERNEIPERPVPLTTVVVCKASGDGEYAAHPL